MLKSAKSAQWIDRSIQDNGLRKSLYAGLSDSLLDRNETISFLRSAQDGGTVSKTEFKDFQVVSQQSHRFWSDIAILFGL